MLDGFGLLPQGPTLSYALAPGQSLCLVGPGGSGKSRFIRTLQGRERCGQGRVDLLDRWIEANKDGFSRRATPTTVSRKFSGQKAGDASHAISALGLWEERATQIDDLSPTQQTACEMLGLLAGTDPIVFIDGHLEQLDPWARDSALAALREKLHRGGAAVVATNRLELCSEFDVVVVMKESRVAFAGTTEELLREGEETELVVESRSQPGVRALVEPFSISVRQTPEGLVMRAREGQAIAAKLLVEGYGDVKTVVTRPPTIVDAVTKIVKRPIR